MSIEGVVHYLVHVIHFKNIFNKVCFQIKEIDMFTFLFTEVFSFWDIYCKHTLRFKGFKIIRNISVTRFQTSDRYCTLASSPLDNNIVLSKLTVSHFKCMIY